MRPRRVAVGVVRVALWLIAAALVLVLALLVALRTGAGKRAVLRVALPLVNARLAGHIAVRGIDGDVWRELVLYDVRLDDAEGLEAFYARRVRAAVDWRAMLHGRYHVRDLRVDGARLTLRHLADNRLNLVALGKAHVGSAPPPRAPRSGEPVHVDIDHAHVQVDAAYHPPRGHEANPINWPRGTFDFDASARVEDGHVRVVVARLVSEARDPLRAHVEIKGALQVTPGRAPGGRAQFAFEDVAVTVVSDGAEIARLQPQIRPRGRWQVHVEGAGTLEALRAHVVASAPAGSVVVDGTLGRTYPGLRWEARAIGEGLNGAADWQGLPEGRVDFDVRSMGPGGAAGATGGGEIFVDKLAADGGGGLHLDGHGRVDLRGRGEGELVAGIDSLARLRALGVPFGPLDRLDGKLAARLVLTGDGHGAAVRGRVVAERLVVAADGAHAEAARVEAHVEASQHAPLRLDVAARGLRGATRPTTPGAPSPTLALRSASLSLRGRPRHFAATVEAATAGGTRASAALVAAIAGDRAVVTVERLRVAGAHRFDLPEPAHLTISGSRSAPALALAFAGAHAEARLHLGAGGVDGDVALAAPELARIGRAAGLTLAGAVRARAHVAWQRALALDVTADGEGLRLPGVAADALHASVHSLDLVGDAHLDGRGVRLGPLALSSLALRAHGTTTHMRLEVDAARRDAHGESRLGFEADGAWRTRGLRVVAGDLVVHTLALALPRQTWRLFAPARLHLGPGAVALEGVVARSGVGELTADARLHDGAVDATVTLRNGDLEELSRVAGHPGLLPAARWSGRIHVGGTLAAPLVDARIDARADHTVAWYGLGFNALALTAYADRRHALVHADAHGYRDTRIVVDAHGLPRTDAGGRIVGVAATLERLRLAVHGHAWDLRAPCRVDIGARLDVDGCVLGSGRAEIALDGSAPLSREAPDPLDVTLATQHLDVRDLGALLAPGHREPPKTDFQVQAHLTGTRRAPVVDVALSGRGSEIDEGGLPENVDYRIRAHYGQERVSGQASMRQVGMRLGVGATFDLPTRLDDDRPISLSLEARPVPFFKIRSLLPAPIADLKGFFTLRVQAEGTTRHPRVSGELHAPSWGLDNLRDNDTVVNVAYDGHQLVVNSVTSFQTTSLLAAILRIRPQRNSGTIAMELRAPFDLGRVVEAPRDAWHALLHDAPLTASAAVRNVDLTRVPLQIVGFDAPVTVGRIDAAFRLEGTLHRPSLHGTVHAEGLGEPGVVDHLDVDAAVALENGRLHLSGAAALRGARLFGFRGVAGLDVHRLVDADARWRQGGLDFVFDVPSYDLARLQNLQPRLHAIAGRLRARASLRGTWALPELHLVGEAAPLQLGGARFAHVRADVGLAARRWRFDVSAEELPTGRLRVAGELPEDWQQPMRMAIDADALDIGFLSALWEEIGAVHGRLAATVRVSGTRAAPHPTGRMRLDGGTFALRMDRRQYQGAMALSVDGDEATLTELTLHGGGGTLRASGRAELDGLRPTRLALDVQADRFEVDYGSAAARLDADFAIAGDRADGIFRGALELKRGTIRLPSLPGSSASLPMGRLDDVRYDDSRARRAAASQEAGQGAFIAAKLEGPLALRSRDAELDLVGELDATLSGGRLGLAGVIEGQKGTVELLGHRYVVERAVLAFGGDANDPELHLRLVRRLGPGTLAIVIEGTAQHPEVRLSADPPVYDEAQLVSIVLSGRTGGERIAVRDLHRQIQGLLSALVIRKIQEDLAPGLPIDVGRPLDQQSYSELSQAPIEIGRYVSDRIYVRYQHRFGARLGRSATNANEASAEYRLGRGFELDTTFGDAGVGGVYLFWTARH